MMDEIMIIADMPTVQWAGFLLASSPVYRYCRNNTDTLICMALETGAHAALKYQQIDGNDILIKNGVQVFRETGNTVCPQLVFAQYQDKANCVVLYQHNIDKVQRILNCSSIADQIPDCLMEHLAIAHEAFHVLEYTGEYPELIRFKVPTWKVGCFQAKAQIQALSEIAAMHFAMKMTNCELSPLLFSYLLLYACNETKAQQYKKQILCWREQNLV